MDYKRMATALALAIAATGAAAQVGVGVGVGVGAQGSAQGGRQGGSAGANAGANANVGIEANGSANVRKEQKELRAKNAARQKEIIEEARRSPAGVGAQSSTSSSTEGSVIRR